MRPDYLAARRAGEASAARWHRADHTGVPTRRRLAPGQLGRWLAGTLVAFALAFPFLYPVLDHHAAERIPTHEHPIATGTERAHLHGFEVSHLHVHGTASTAVEPAAVAAIHVESAVAELAFLVLSATAIPLLATVLRPTVVGWARALPAPYLRHQVLSPPPVPPPTVPFVWAS